MSDDGRVFSKKSFSTSARLSPFCFASPFSQSSTPSVRVGPGSTAFTVTAVPSVSSASPRESPSCAVFVTP